MSITVSVNWEEPPLKRWLNEVARSHTRESYCSAWKAYALYTKMSATELLKEAAEDAKKDPTEKTGILKERILGFYNWLLKEYPVKSRGSGKHKVDRKGVRPKTADSWVGVIRGFYQTFELSVTLKGRSKLPTPRVYNKRPQLTIMDIKRLVNHTRNPRDRAIILTTFQSGCDVSTLCSIKYGDIAKGLMSNEEPLRLELLRGKTGTEYYTFIGRDAIESIRAYLDDAKSRGIKFTDETALFVKETGKGETLDTDLIQNMMRETARRSGFIDENNNGKDMNPYNPHALREAFGSIMINSGVPDTIVDFWLGHKIGEMSEAYKSVRFEEVRKMYAEKERFISISSQENEAVTKQLSEQKEITNALNLQILSLTNRLEKVEKAIQDLLR